MPSEQQCFDLVLILTGGQFLISPARSQIQGSIVIGVILIATVHTAERLLAHAIRSIHIMATRAFLGGIGGFDGVGGHASFGGGPFDLLRQVRQVGGVEIRVHGASLEAHASN